MSRPLDKRRSERLPLVREVQAHFDTVESVVHTQSLDVGRHGFLLASPTLSPVGTMVRFLMTIESPSVRLELNGRVVRVEPATATRQGRMAVELLEQDGEWDRVYSLLVASRATLGR